MLSGKGMYIWQLNAAEMGQAYQIARDAKAAGFSHVLVKIANGTYTFNVVNGVDLAMLLAVEMKRVGIQVWGWHYVYGYDPVGEAAIAVKRVNELGLDGYVVDAEGEYKSSGSTRAREFMQRVRSGLGNLPIALSSYRYPSLHPEFPWGAFLEFVDINMPQVYWMQAHNPAAQLANCVSEFKALSGRPIIPTGAAFHEAGWQATAEEIYSFWNAVKTLGLTGGNFWEWANAKRYKLFDAVANLGSEAGETPEPETAYTSGEILADLGVRMRAAPTASGAYYGVLPRGYKVNVLETAISGSDVWVRIARGIWMCARQGASQWIQLS